MLLYENLKDGKTYLVTSYSSKEETVWQVIDYNAPLVEQPKVVAVYKEKWRAENHAIMGCGCVLNHHYYHGPFHENQVIDYKTMKVLGIKPWEHKCVKDKESA